MSVETKTNRGRVPRKDLYKYSVESIILDSNFDYSRIDLSDIETLAESILENGVQEPLIGFKNPDNKDEVVVVHGVRRYHALQIAKEKGFSGTVLFNMKNAKGYTTAQKHIDIAIANDGKEMTGLEKGRLFSSLEKEGLNRKEISSKLKVTQAHISDMISLTSLPNPIQNAIMGGMISSSLALKIGKENKTPEAQLEVFETAKADMENAVQEEKSTGEVEKPKKTTKKITAKNVKSGVSKTPLKTLEAVVNADSNIDEHSLVVLKKAYSLLKKKVSVEEFIEAFSQVEAEA